MVCPCCVDNSCTTANDCGCVCVGPAPLGFCADCNCPEQQAACEACGGVYFCDPESGATECLGWADNPECIGGISGGQLVCFTPGGGPAHPCGDRFTTRVQRPCCGGQCCQEEFDEYLDRTEKNLELAVFTCCDGVCSVLGVYFDEDLDQDVYEECPP